MTEEELYDRVAQRLIDGLAPDLEKFSIERLKALGEEVFYRDNMSRRS